jgi:predicted nucleic acid-binding Zn ribbon protein
MRSIQQVTPSVIAEIIRRQPASAGRTTFAWQVAVGAALARATTVELASGVLTVRATDPRWIADLESARPIVLQRLQHLLGPSEVRTIRITKPESGPRG